MRNRLRLATMTAALVFATSCTGGGSHATSTSTASTSTPPSKSPHVEWIAAKVDVSSQGGDHESYYGLAASKDILVGLTTGYVDRPSGSTSPMLLTRIDISNGEVVWTHELPVYFQAYVAVHDNTILLVAPGGEEGQDQGLAYGFDANGVQKWQVPLGIVLEAIRDPSAFVTEPWGREQTSRLPGSPDDSITEVICDVDQIPGVLLIYEATPRLLRGINTEDGSTWTYQLETQPDRIVGPDPGGPPELHIVTGTDVISVDGKTGKEVKRGRVAPQGHDIGANSSAPSFDPTSFLATLHNDSGYESVFPLSARSKGVVYGVLRSTAGRFNTLVALDVTTSKVLWKWVITKGGIHNDGAAAADGFLAIPTSEGTTLLRP